jgi:hypothetical protein
MEMVENKRTTILNIDHTNGSYYIGFVQKPCYNICSAVTAQLHG